MFNKMEPTPGKDLEIKEWSPDDPDEVAMYWASVTLSQYLKNGQANHEVVSRMKDSLGPVEHEIHEGIILSEN